jgi:hypothetical protein
MRGSGGESAVPRQRERSKPAEPLAARRSVVAGSVGASGGETALFGFMRLSLSLGLAFLASMLAAILPLQMG